VTGVTPNGTISYRININERLAGRTIKGIFQSEFKFSTRLLRDASLRDAVTKNGVHVYLTHSTELGDEIYVMLPTETTELIPHSMDVDIQYEDEEVIVVNKPSGFLTHPTAQERTGSILALGMVPHSVHRLDRDTSGLIMFAKHAHAHHLFDIALRAGDLHRTYCAIIVDVGAFDVPPPGEWATIDLPIAQDMSKPSKRIISAAGQRAITHYRVMGQAGDAKLVQIVLETGRTHQIRVHFSGIGMPLVGDKAYGVRQREGKTTADANIWRGFPRQALHAHQLAWRHPVYGDEHVVRVGPPADMIDLWRALGGSDEIWQTLLTDDSALRLGKPV
jgi:23S rRNA pseudouridine1911/1915/1917 synthase